MMSELRYKAIPKCRICGNTELEPTYDLGLQALTGVFPKPGVDVLKAPLELLKCSSEMSCGLVQLRHTTDFGLMYGDTYGYRTGLNQSMVKHVNSITKKAIQRVKLNSGDLVIDIGSNDSTLLQGYLKQCPEKLLLLGVDPSVKKFKEYYPPEIKSVADFFSKANVEAVVEKSCKAKIITSISMFYDLEQPMNFMKEVYELLHEDGIWVLEQSYLPEMMKSNSFDTICHEHLEYYELKQIKWMADRIGFKFVDIEFNDANGGSFAITLAKKESQYHKSCETLVEKILEDENKNKYSSLASFRKLRLDSDTQIFALLRFFERL